MNGLLDRKAEPVHYILAALSVMGLYYLISVLTHGSGGPLTDTTVDVSSMIILGG